MVLEPIVAMHLYIGYYGTQATRAYDVIIAYIEYGWLLIVARHVFT